MMSKEDNTLKRLRYQFIAKTKIKTDKILEDEDSSDEGEDSVAMPGKKKKQSDAKMLGEQAVNPIKEFK